MAKVQNVSRHDIEVGNHIDSSRAVLIQISDPDSEHPQPAKSFVRAYQYKFLDIEDKDECLDPAWRFNNVQADEISIVLQLCRLLGYDVVVHCHMGVCRSGAIAECAEALGFKYAGNGKTPNQAVKTLLMKSLGLYIDESNSAFNSED